MRELEDKYYEYCNFVDPKILSKNQLHYWFITCSERSLAKICDIDPSMVPGLDRDDEL
jgi:hypothetical protein